MSVAIPIPLLQHLPDVNVSLGVGVDENVLTYDHDTARFVLRAMSAGVTDHGALMGLSDDDHAQYALLAGRAGGTTLYGGTAANDNITIHGTSNATRTTSYVLLQPTAGKVGIGTTAPVNLLQVGNGTQNNAAVVVNGPALTSYTGMSIQTSSVEKWFWGRDGTDSTDDFILRASGATNILRAFNSGSVANTLVLNAGSIGIGTTAPATALHVVGAATITAGIRPAADSTTALQLQTVAGTNVLNVDTTNARVGIGTSAPTVPFHVQGISALFQNAGGISIALNDSSSSQVPMLNFQQGGVTKSYIEGGVGLGNRIDFCTGTTRILTISNALVGISVQAPAAKLHIDQSSETAAKPVLTVDQADVSEEFVRFIGTSTTDASQSLVDATNMTTPGALTGWLKIYVQDDQATNPITDGTYYVPFYAAPTA